MEGRMKARLARITSHAEHTTGHTGPVVMDVLPWPGGYGFAGHSTWWQHVLSQSERERLDNLIGLALLDNEVCERLVTKRDRALLSAFGLSEQTQDWLKNITASTLKELAQAIVEATRPGCLDALSSEAA
jgi:hypothetical protein